MSSAELATIERAIRSARASLSRLAGRIARAQGDRDAAAATLREASGKLRRAEQSLEQIDQLDARLAEEEIRAFEQQEEVEAEPVGRPRRKQAPL